MNAFIRRIRHLQSQLSVKAFPVTLIYDNGTEKIMRCLDAVAELLRDRSIVDIRCAGDTEKTFFASLLKAEQLYGSDFEDLEELR